LTLLSTNLLDSKESKSTDNILSSLTFIIKHLLSYVLPQIEILLKIFLTLAIGNMNAMSELRRLNNYLCSTIVQNRTTNLALLSMKYEAA